MVPLFIRLMRRGNFIVEEACNTSVKLREYKSYKENNILSAEYLSKMLVV